MKEIFRAIALVLWMLGGYQAHADAAQQTEIVDSDMLMARMMRLNEKGIKAEETGRYPQALAFYEEGLAIARGHDHKEGIAAFLTNIGIVYDNLGQYAKALEHYGQALMIRREIGDRRGEGGDLTNAGLVYSNLGQYAKALEYYRQALAIKREIGDRRGEGITLTNIGVIYSKLSQHTEALEHYARALEVKREVGDQPGEGITLSNIGVVYDKLGQYENALNHYEQALAIDRKIGNRVEEGQALGNIGITYKNLGQYAKALEYYDQALAICRDIGDRLGESHNLGNISSLYRSLDQYAKALEHYHQPLSVLAGIGAPESRWRTWNGMSESLARLHQPQAAILAGKQAVNTLQAMRAANTRLNRHLQQSFLKDKTVVYRDLADLLIDQGRLPEAQQVLAMLKEEEYFDFIRRDGKGDSRNLASLTEKEHEWDARYQRIAGRLVSIGRELDALEKKSSRDRTDEEEARIAELRRDKDASRKVFQQVLKDLQAQFDDLDKERYAELARRQLDVGLSGLVRDLERKTGKGVVLLHFLVLEDHLRIILTTAQVQKAYTVDVGSNALRHKVARLQQALGRSDTNPLPEAQALYGLLIGPLEDDLQQAHSGLLMVSLDDALRYIPIAALHDGEHWLIERYAISVFTDAARDRVKDDPRPEWEVAGLGLSKAVKVEDASAENGVRVFLALDAVPAELDGIVRREADDADGVLDGEMYLDSAFTSNRLRDALGQEFPVVHLASHFRFNPGTEKDSYLVLGDGNRLDLEQLRNQDFDFGAVDLLTLSACETGVGGDGRGTEVESLAITAQKAGAKGVLATLWPVVDRSTGLLMQDVYRLRQQQHLSKAEALRHAQLAFLRGDQRDKDGKPLYAHPYYWAPFILMGNWL